MKVITHSHNGNGYTPVVNAIFRPLVNKASLKELSCSDEATNWLFGEKRQKSVITVNNGIDVERFTFNAQARKEIRNKYHISDDALVIGHIGRFSEQKNHKFILKVFKQVLNQRPDAILMLVGTGELKDEIKKQISNLNLQQKVILCGLQARTDDFYCGFYIFLMPSLYEGLPVVGVEAQCEGLPCFFSNNISKEIKITDLSLFISLDESPVEWSKKILAQTLTDRKKYPAIVDKENFSIKSTVKELESIYGVR